MSKTVSFDVAGFEDFRHRALDSQLSQNEKIGFPDTYRAEKSSAIIADILTKLTCLQIPDKTILDVGPGCGELAQQFIKICVEQGHNLVLVDSKEMLEQLPNNPAITKIAGRFPDCRDAIQAAHTNYDAVLTYSVVQYVYAELSLYGFVDHAASFLAPGGQFLIGDIPNASRRKRFLASEAGRQYHNEHYADKPFPEIGFNSLEIGQIDDGVILGLVSRLRSAGYDSFILPQNPELPMANRREDILIVRP